MMDYEAIIDSPETLAANLDLLADIFGEGQHLIIKVEQATEAKKRTLLQNSSLHKWCELCAKALNDAGMSQYRFFEILEQHGIELDWDKDSYKKEVFKRTQKAMKNQDSTTEASRTDYNDVYNALCRFFGSHGVSLPAWPDRFSQMEEAA